MCFESAKWIWSSKNKEKDCYVEFYRDFLWEDGEVVCRLSCDGDYTLYVNGNYVSSNQYGDYEHYKIYDEINITSCLNAGKNHFAVLVWHIGEGNSKYCPAQPGLIFEIAQESGLLAVSDEDTTCRQSPTYRSGEKKWITVQMGFSFFYDANKEDGWTVGNAAGDFETAEIVKKDCQFYPCPIKKLRHGEKTPVQILKSEESYYLIDLGKETVGVPVLEFSSEGEQLIRVEWGEDLQNGHVRRIIHNRDFSFEYMAKPGDNTYINYMQRIGGRYLEVYAEKPVKVSYIGVIPHTYPVNVAEKKFENPLDQDIYDVCLATLKLCMMEHYVDTPWREQCLYTYDARNQMLCGYHAFTDKNAEYARANLKLISQDRREDGLLAITYPCGIDLTIPSFSFYYFLAVNEYITYTGDVDFGREVYPKLLSVLDVFLKNRKNGLICRFTGTNHWNFYDWTDHLEGTLRGSQEAVPDLMINCLFVAALKNLQEISLKINGTGDQYQDMLKETKAAIKKTFYNKSKGLFSMTQGGDEYVALGNAFAILVGVTEMEESQYICQQIVENQLIDCSLSMKMFKYDALLLVDQEKYLPVILDEIRSDYGKMLENGATSVWETIDGAAAFDNAGSLCHGWSAVPVYYYNLFF